MNQRMQEVDGSGRNELVLSHVEMEDRSVGVGLHPGGGLAGPRHSGLGQL